MRYVKELLVDLVNSLASPETKADLTSAIQRGIYHTLLTFNDVALLEHYLSGYTLSEMAKITNQTQNEIEERLYRILTIVEELSQYTDDTFIRSISEQIYNPQEEYAIRYWLKNDLFSENNERVIKRNDKSIQR